MHFNNMHGNKNIGRRRCYKNLMRLSAQQQHLSSFEPIAADGEFAEGNYQNGAFY
jgi:hypothetical protein